MRGGTGIVRSLGARALKRLVLAVTALCMLIAVAAIPAASAETLEDFSGGAYQILPPGAEGGLEQGKYARDQAKLYEKLTPKRGKVTQETIEKDYLPEKFGVRGFPTLIVIDKQGKVHDIHVGYSPTLREEVGSVVRELLVVK